MKLISAQQTEAPPIDANMAGVRLITCATSKWIIDNGAIDHICTYLALFSSYKKFTKLPNTINIIDGKQVVVDHIGTVDFRNGITLENV